MVKNLKNSDKKNLSQEQLAELSFHENCYVPIATLKRAEKSCSISNRIINNFCALFGIGREEVIEQDPTKETYDELNARSKLSSFLDKHADDKEVQDMLKQYIK